MIERTFTQEEENFLALFSELQPGRETHVLKLVDDLMCSRHIVDTIRAEGKEQTELEWNRNSSDSSPRVEEVLKMLAELEPPLK